jgi:hypothetical protein
MVRTREEATLAEIGCIFPIRNGHERPALVNASLGKFPISNHGKDPSPQIGASSIYSLGVHQNGGGLFLESIERSKNLLSMAACRPARVNRFLSAGPSDLPPDSQARVIMSFARCSAWTSSTLVEIKPTNPVARAFLFSEKPKRCLSSQAVRGLLKWM